jgi:DNA-binding response OmpR family regulator
VLVVEDELLIAMELDDVLQDAGFQVLGPVASVEGALDRLRTERPHAAVLDVSLRGERVTPVAEVLLSMNVPFVLTTAFGEADLAGEPPLANARKLGKPTPPGQLVNLLRHLVGWAAG